MEVKYIWGQKFRLSTLLYVICRYSLIVNLLFPLAKSGYMGTKVSQRRPGIADLLTCWTVKFRSSPLGSLSMTIIIFSCDFTFKFLAAFSVLGRGAVICQSDFPYYSVPFC